VVHSLGGLATQAAVGQPRSLEEYIRKVRERIRGILFLGTPRSGADLAKWADFGTRSMSIAQNANVDIVAVLKPGSKVLALMQKDFHRLSD
jgi:hypothetical protein